MRRARDDGRAGVAQVRRSLPFAAALHENQRRPVPEAQAGESTVARITEAPCAASGSRPARARKKAWSSIPCSRSTGSSAVAQPARSFVSLVLSRWRPARPLTGGRAATARVPPLRDRADARCEALRGIHDETAAGVAFQIGPAVLADDARRVRFEPGDAARMVAQFKCRHPLRGYAELAHRRFMHDDRGPDRPEARRPSCRGGPSRALPGCRRVDRLARHTTPPARKAIRPGRATW